MEAFVTFANKCWDVIVFCALDIALRLLTTRPQENGALFCARAIAKGHLAIASCIFPSSLQLHLISNPAITQPISVLIRNPDPTTTAQDLPDVKGDRKYNISTFASKRGVKFTARAACAVLGLNYISAMVEGILSPGEPSSVNGAAPSGVYEYIRMCGGGSFV